MGHRGPVRRWMLRVLPWTATRVPWWKVCPIPLGVCRYGGICVRVNGLPVGLRKWSPLRLGVDVRRLSLTLWRVSRWALRLGRTVGPLTRYGQSQRYGSCLR